VYAIVLFIIYSIDLIVHLPFDLTVLWLLLVLLYRRCVLCCLLLLADYDC